MTVTLPPNTGNVEVDQWAYDVTQTINDGGLGGGTITQDDLDDYVRVSNSEVVVGNNELGYLLRYLDIAYATDGSGTNFSDTIGGLPSGTTTIFQGRRNTSSTTESNNPAQFSWVELAGDLNSSSTKAYYRLIGGKQIIWSFVTSAPSGFIEDDGAIIDLESAFAGNDGEDPITVNISTNNGVALKDSIQNTTLTANVRIGAVLQNNAAHNNYHYRWSHGGAPVCVNSGREVLNTTQGTPLVATLTNNVWVCSTGFVADNEVSASDTQFGGDLRSITVGTEDVQNTAQFVVEVSNIPD